jgi:hypothetical protein
MVFEEIYNLFLNAKSRIIVLATILVVFILVVILLVYLEKKLTKKAERHKESRNLYYRKKLKEISKLKPEEVIDLMGKLARDFFKEAFDISYHIEYTELADRFKKMKKEECAKFCNTISTISYSGDKVKPEQIKDLVELLDIIISENRIVQNKEKKKKREVKED